MEVTAAVGSAAVHDAFSRMMTMPGFGISWQVENAEVSASGDMAVTTGHYTMKMQGPDGAAEDRGKYLTMWKKVNGTWLVSHDIANSDLPASAAPADAGGMMKH